jgi:hypothetical protein
MLNSGRRVERLTALHQQLDDFDAAHEIAKGLLGALGGLPSSDERESWLHQYIIPDKFRYWRLRCPDTSTLSNRKPRCEVLQLAHEKFILFSSADVVSKLQR